MDLRLDFDFDEYEPIVDPREGEMTPYRLPDPKTLTYEDEEQSCKIWGEIGECPLPGSRKERELLGIETSGTQPVVWTAFRILQGEGRRSQTPVDVVPELYPTPFKISKTSPPQTPRTPRTPRTPQTPHSPDHRAASPPQNLWTSYLDVDSLPALDPGRTSPFDPNRDAYSCIAQGAATFAEPIECDVQIPRAMDNLFEPLTPCQHEEDEIAAELIPSMSITIFGEGEDGNLPGSNDTDKPSWLDGLDEVKSMGSPEVNNPWADNDLISVNVDSASRIPAFHSLSSRSPPSEEKFGGSERTQDDADDGFYIPSVMLQSELSPETFIPSTGDRMPKDDSFDFGGVGLDLRDDDEKNGVEGKGSSSDKNRFYEALELDTSAYMPVNISGMQGVSQLAPHPGSKKKSNSHSRPHDHSSDTVCAVCLETDTPVSVKLLPCAHSFHPACITRWVESNYSCPLCRQSIELFIPITQTSQTAEREQDASISGRADRHRGSEDMGNLGDSARILEMQGDLSKLTKIWHSHYLSGSATRGDDDMAEGSLVLDDSLKKEAQLTPSGTQAAESSANPSASRDSDSLEVSIRRRLRRILRLHSLLESIVDSTSDDVLQDQDQFFSSAPYAAHQFVYMIGQEDSREPGYEGTTTLSEHKVAEVSSTRADIPVSIPSSMTATNEVVSHISEAECAEEEEEKERERELRDCIENMAVDQTHSLNGLLLHLSRELMMGNRLLRKTVSASRSLQQMASLARPALSSSATESSAPRSGPSPGVSAAEARAVEDADIQRMIESPSSSVERESPSPHLTSLMSNLDAQESLFERLVRPSLDTSATTADALVAGAFAGFSAYSTSQLASNVIPLSHLNSSSGSLSAIPRAAVFFYVYESLKDLFDVQNGPQACLGNNASVQNALGCFAAASSAAFVANAPLMLRSPASLASVSSRFGAHFLVFEAVKNAMTAAKEGGATTRDLSLREILTAAGAGGLASSALLYPLSKILDPVPHPSSDIASKVQSAAPTRPMTGGLGNRVASSVSGASVLPGSSAVDWRSLLRGMGASVSRTLPACMATAVAYEYAQRQLKDGTPPPE